MGRITTNDGLVRLMVSKSMLIAVSPISNNDESLAHEELKDDNK